MSGGHDFACFWASYLSLALGIGNVVSNNSAVPFVFSEYYDKCHPLIAQQTSQDPDAGHV